MTESDRAKGTLDKIRKGLKVLCDWDVTRLTKELYRLREQGSRG